MPLSRPPNLPAQPPAPRSGRPLLAAMLLALAAFAALLVHGSAPIGMIDQGDYPRTVSRIVGETLPAPADARPGAPATRWTLAEGLPHPNPSSGTSSFLFAAAALLQSRYQDRFDLRQLGLAAKLAFGLGLGLLAVAAGRRLGIGAAGQVLIATALLLVSFASHNAAFLQSLYGEFSYFLGLPVLLSAMLWPEGRLRRILLFTGLVLCGGAKAQFFYLPLLALAVLWLHSRALRQRLPMPTLAVLLLAQAVCAAPLLISDVMGFNRHHSTYVGSYLAMTEAERDRLGLDPAQRACIGVDAWGNRLPTIDSTRPLPGAGPCAAARDKTFLDTLRPYAVAPLVAWRLVGTGLPPHLTVRYFHVSTDTPYVVLLTRKTGRITQGLQQLSFLRDALVRPWTLPLLLLAALACSAHAFRQANTGLAAPLLLLVLLFASQVPIALLGEGVRDLSKHLAGAQFALDLMVVLVICQVALGGWRRSVLSGS